MFKVGDLIVLENFQNDPTCITWEVTKIVDSETIDVIGTDEDYKYYCEGEPIELFVLKHRPEPKIDYLSITKSIIDV